MDHPHQVHHQKSFFDLLPSKQSFWLGFGTAILTIGTLGFIMLGSCVLQGSCAVGGLAFADAEDSDDDKGTVKAAAVAAAPTADAIPPGTVPLVSDVDHIRGNVDAPITIIEYSDFECPFCSRFHPTMLQVMEEYDGDVRWVLRHFPLSFHPEANPAANAVECAGEQGKFWEYGDELFENQSDLGDDLYLEIATDLGLNLSDWQTCYDDERYADHIATDAREGASAGVTGTPGSFIIDEDGNATPIKGALPFSSVAAAIDAML